MGREGRVIVQKSGSLQEVKKLILRDLKRNIGPGVYISGERKIDNEQILLVVGNCFPAFAHRPSNEKPFLVKFVDFSDLAVVKLAKEEKDKYRVYYPSRDSIDKKNKEKYMSIVSSAERTLLNATYTKYVKIPLVQTALTTIKSILITLEEDTYIDPSIYPKRERGKLLRYLSFLEDLGYVRKERNRYIEANKLIVIKGEFANRYPDKEEFFNVLLADILRVGYPYMKKYLRLLQIVPYLRIATAYYLPSYQFDELLYISKTKFAQFIARYLYSFYNVRTAAYRGKPDIRLKEQIHDVINCEILIEEDGNIVGDKEIFENFSRSLPSSY